jgi:hypothetical protein
MGAEVRPKSRQEEYSRQDAEARWFMVEYFRRGLGLLDFTGFTGFGEDHNFLVPAELGLRSKAFPGFYLTLNGKIHRQVGFLRTVALLEKNVDASSFAFTTYGFHRDVVRQYDLYSGIVTLHPHPMVDVEINGKVQIPERFYPLNDLPGIYAAQGLIDSVRMAVDFDFKLTYRYDSTLKEGTKQLALPAHFTQEGARG